MNHPHTSAPGFDTAEERIVPLYTIAAVSRGRRRATLPGVITKMALPSQPPSTTGVTSVEVPHAALDATMSTISGHTHPSLSLDIPQLEAFCALALVGLGGGEGVNLLFPIVQHYLRLRRPRVRPVADGTGGLRWGQSFRLEWKTERQRRCPSRNRRVTRMGFISFFCSAFCKAT